MFSLRIVDTDHYLATPIPQLDVCFADFRQAELKRVPVVRIYGATPQGQKACMHLHGVFPYMYVPSDGSFSSQYHLRQFACSIDKALNVALGNSSATTQHVYKISLVSGIPFYGYHGSETQFLKIYFINPLMVKKAADLLLGGAVMNKVFQPHETHIPYRLQLFIDYNLYGMNMINVAAVKFRQSPKNDNANPSHISQKSDEGSTPGQLHHSLSLGESFLSKSVCTQMWEVENIPSEMWLDTSVERQSTCELEVDVVAADILNRHEVGANVGANPGLVALWEDEQQRRRVKGDVTELKAQESQDRGHVEWSEAEALLQERLQQILQDLAPYIEESDSEASEDVTPSGSQLDLSITPADLQATPSSVLELHLSQSQGQDLNSSQETVILEGDQEDSSPIVNLNTVQRVVSLSQSFRAERGDSHPLKIPSSQDRSLAHILASLADDSPAASQVASQIISSEEQDSILTGISPADDKDDDGESLDEEEETMEMSQVIWEGQGEGHLDDEQVEGQTNEASDKGDENENGEKEQNLSQLSFNLEGMDQSWNSSLWQDVTNQNVPQLDGTSDDKQQDDTVHHEKKRLGTRGAVISRSTKDASIKSNGEKIHPLGELHVLLKQVQKQREAMKSVVEAGRNGENSRLVLDLRSPTPMPVHNVEETSDSEADIVVDDKVTRFTLEPGGSLYARVSASEESDADSVSDGLNASGDLFDEKSVDTTKSHRYGNIFSTLSSELSGSELALSGVSVEISRDIQLPFNRDHLSSDSKDRLLEKYTSISDGSERIIESDSEDHYSVDSFVGFRKTSCIVPRRPSSESSTASTDTELHVGPHTFTYDRTAFLKKERPQFTQILDKNKPFPEILKELETVDDGAEKGSIDIAESIKNKDNVCNDIADGQCSHTSLTQQHEDRPCRSGGEQIASDLSEYEELLPDQDSTSVSENEAGMLDLTGCDDPVDIIEYTSDVPCTEEIPVKKRGRPPGKSPKKASTPKNEILLLHRKTSTRKIKSPWKIREDFVHDLSSWVSSAESSDFQGSPRGESSDSSYIPYISKDAERTVKRNKLSLSKKKRKRSESAVMTCKPIVEDRSHVSRLDVYEGDLIRVIHKGDQLTYKHSVKISDAKNAKKNGPAGVAGKEERVWFSSTAAIGYCDGQKSTNLQALECCVQVRKDEYFKYDFSKICNEKLCLNSVTNELLEKCSPVAMVQSSETKESIDDSSESGTKKTAAMPSIVTDILKDNSRSAVSETVETVVVKNPALLSVKAAEKGSSRRSSADGQVAEKGQVCELDFSFLENPMDTDAEGIQRPETEDPHLQLHTPPLMIDPDQSENMSMPAQDQELMETNSASPRDADVQLTTQTEARTSADGQEAENSMCSFNFAVTGSQSDQNRLSNVELNGIENISSQDSQDKLLNSTGKKVYTELVNKNKTKKRSNSLSDYYSDAVDDWEEAVKRKKSKHIQSDHYKYRFKRRSADCAESAFSLIYQMESSTAAQQDETIAAPQKKHKGKEKQVPGIHYIIVNKFKGYKSMSVVTPKLKITSSVNVNEYLSNVEKYCWKKNEEPTTYEREQRLLDDSNRESNIVKPSRSAQGRKSGQAKAKRKHARSRYERLSQCFVTRKHRRKKSSGTQSAKFMDTLSLLHDITLAKLTDSPAAVSYCDTTDDHKTAYNDVMFNLALFSPPSSDNGNASPPQPLSPSEDVDSVALHAEEKYSVRGRSVSSPASARLTLTEPLYDTPLSSVEANKCQPKSPDNLASISSENISCYHDIQMDARTQGGGVGGSPHQPDSIVHRRDSNSSGSLYAVKEAVVRFTPPVSTTKLFTSLKYPSDILPPDLGPPLCRQVSPRSLHSGSSGSPPSLHSHYDQSPRLVESDSSCSGAESAPDDQVRMEQSYMYLYSDVDNVVSRIPGQLQHAGSLCGSNPSSARNSTRQSFDSDNSVDGALPQTVSPSHSNDYTGSYAGSGRGSHYSGSDSSSPRNKYEVQCEPISDSSDGEEEHVSKHTPSRESSKHSKKIRKPPAVASPASAVSTGLSHSPRVKSPSLAPVEQEQEQHHSSFQESLFEDNLFTTQSPPSLSNPVTQQTTASHAETSPQTQTSSINNSSPTLPEYCMQQSPLPQSTSVDSSQHPHSQGNGHTSIVSPYTQPSGQSLYSRHSGQSSESPFHSVQSPPPHYPHRASSQPQHSSCDNLSIVIQHNIDNSSAGSECPNSAVTVATDIDNCSTESPLSSLQRDPRYLHHQSLEASTQMPCGSMQQSPPQQSGSLKSPAAGSFMQQSPPQQSPSHRSPAVGNFMQQSPVHQSLNHRYPATAPSSFMQQSSNHSSPATSGSFMQQSSSQQSPSHRSPAAPPSFMQPSPSCGDSSTVIQQSPNLPSPRHYDNSVKQSSIQHSPLSGYSIQQSPVRVPQPSPVHSSPSHCTSMQQSPLHVSSVHPSPSHSSSIQQSPVESVSFQQSPSAQNNASMQQQSVHDNASTQQSPYNSNAMQQQSPYNPTMQQSPYNNATMQQHSPHNNATIQQHSPHNATIQQHSPHNNMTMPQHSPHNATIQQHSPHNNMTMPQHSPHNNATIQQHSPHNNMTMQQHSPHNATIQQHSPHNNVTMQQHSSHNNVTMQQHSPHNATMQQHSPHNNVTMQQHSSHNNVTMQQHSPHNATMQQHSPHNSATMQQQSLHNNATIQQQSPLQCGSLQLSPHATAVPPAGQMQHSPGQTFHSAHSPGYNVPPPLPQTQLHYSQNVPLSSAQMLTQHSPVQSVPPSRLFREKHRQSVKNKKLNSQGYVGSDILSPVSDHSQNSPRGQYSSMLHSQDFPAKDQQNFDSGPRRLDERTSLLNDIRQFDASHHSHGDEQLTENCYMPPHPMASMFDLNRHSDNNMGMIPPSYSNYPHRHASNPGGASFASMPPMYHSPPTLHQNQHNFATQYPTNGGSQGEPSHHSLGPPSHHSQYSPHSCSGYEHGWNSHPGMYPTSAFRHASCGREEPPGWYPHSGRDPLTVITPMLPPPTKSHLLSGILGYGLSEVQHRDPFCSNHGDLPDRPR